MYNGSCIRLFFVQKQSDLKQYIVLSISRPHIGSLSWLFQLQLAVDQTLILSEG